MEGWGSAVPAFRLLVVRGRRGCRQAIASAQWQLPCLFQGRPFWCRRLPRVTLLWLVDLEVWTPITVPMLMQLSSAGPCLLQLSQSLHVGS